MNMQFIKDFKWTPVNILKVIGFVIIGLVIISFAFQLLSPVFVSMEHGVSGMMPFSTSNSITEEAYYKGEGYVVAQDASADYGYGGNDLMNLVNLSARNIGIVPPQPGGGSIGVGAEDVEVTEYYASFETGNSEKLCGKVMSLKAREDVIFESANEYDQGCNYAFKVVHANAPDILAFINDLDPRDLSENTYTIQKQLNDFTSEEDILKAKLASINETLASALRAYDDITRLATRTENADALAKIIDSKIGIIERLTEERINVNASLERLLRNKESAIDRLTYTHFLVNVYENKFLDGRYIVDSWRVSIKNFVHEINKVAQDITINLVLLIILIAQYVFYFALALFAVKYAWRCAKYVWNK